VAQSVRFMPVSIFGAVMGVAGLALVSRNAHQVLGVPNWMAASFGVLAMLMLVGLLVAYALKWVRHRAEVIAEFANAGQLAFFGTVPIALALTAGCVTLIASDFTPALTRVALLLWWIACALWAVLAPIALARWLRGGVELAQVNTGWMIMLIGPVPMAVGGLAAGELESARVMFGIGLVFSSLVMVLAFIRTIIGPPLPLGVRPMSFVLLVPMGLVYALAPSLWDVPNSYLLETLFYFEIMLAVALFIASRDWMQWPFTPAWWGLTFPLDALAAAALAYAKFNSGVLPTALAWITWGIALAVVMVVLVRSLVAFAGGTFFGPPKAA
jgi:tellurite resistance protein